MIGFIPEFSLWCGLRFVRDGAGEALGYDLARRLVDLGWISPGERRRLTDDGRAALEAGDLVASVLRMGDSWPRPTPDQTMARRAA